MRLHVAAVVSLAVCLSVPALAADPHPHILQQPSISRDLIVFSYAGDLWTVPRTGGRATRLTTGVGIESQPVFSPDGQTIAFTGEYDGNTDVFTIPATGGIPKRITYHPAADVAVGWTSDGKSILFRSNRDSASRYTQLFEIPAQGGVAKALPLPMAYEGELSPDASRIAYNPLGPGSGFNFTAYVSWGNYHGGLAPSLWITTLPGLDSVEVPHETSADYSPTWVDGKVYFLSGRKGAISIFSYDPASKTVAEVYQNTGDDIHSLASDGHTLVFDRLGELYTMEPGGQPHMLDIDVTGDMPDVRAHFVHVADQIENMSLSPSGIRVAVEAHGEILTVPAKHGAIRNLTNSPGVMEREPAWSPDGQSVAFFSDEPGPDGKPGLYHLHVVSQTGAGTVKKFALAPEPAYYFGPVWSPDSKLITFFDNRLHRYLLDTTTGKLTQLGEPNVFGGFSNETHAVAWSPDSKWLVYPRSMPNHLHSLYLYSVDKGTSTQLTDEMADSHSPTFDRNGKYLYFLASNNQGATEAGLDMTSDLYTVTDSIYSLALTAKTLSPVAPESDDEKAPSQVKEEAKEKTDVTPAGAAAEENKETTQHPNLAQKPMAPRPTEIDLAGMTVDQIAGRIAALPLPAASYSDLSTGKPGTIYFLESSGGSRRFGGGGGNTLSRYVLEGRKTEKLAEHVMSYELSADGEKMLLRMGGGEEGEGGPPANGERPAPKLFIVSATAPVKPGDGAVALNDLEVKVDPAAEWKQMYHEIWRIERAYFYDTHFHGVNTVEEEARFEPYVDAVQSRADLNYIFQDMLMGFSVGHLRGHGGAIPEAQRVPGGLLGADYTIKDNRYCIAKIYTGGTWSPTVKAPLAQPGLNVHVGDCILAINGENLTAATNIQEPLEGTAGHAVTLHIGAANGDDGRDVSVVPVPNELQLRNIDWIDANQRKVDELSGGKLAYVYLPDTGAGGFTNFNRYFMAQTDKEGVIVDERYNGGGQVADYIIEVLGRKIEAYWTPRYGAIEHTPNAGIYGPKVMIINESAGSGGDAMPWLFKHNQLGTLVGKRTWGGLVGIGEIPVLMDGGAVTSPSVAFFSPAGKWEVENHGVDPDVVVDQDPKAVSEGHDPQLEKAVAVAMEQLKQNPPPEPHKPAYPNYHEK
ncbi:MAG TPA: PDZ domain-containing protein [Candidatus Aquilonibacter sp.]|nr:PDZ domain-containing protein [Candidatus Aquilonibacter sp.]